MAKREHLLTLVEPTKGGDATLDLAHNTVERGGDATVVMVITDRVRRDISDYAASENLDRADAEGRALTQLDSYCRTRVGGSTNVETRYSGARTDVAKLVTPEITAIAMKIGTMASIMFCTVLSAQQHIEKWCLGRHDVLWIRMPQSWGPLFNP